jgi:hypothetical protein
MCSCVVFVIAQMGAPVVSMRQRHALGLSHWLHPGYHAVQDEGAAAAGVFILLHCTTNSSSFIDQIPLNFLQKLAEMGST